MATVETGLLSAEAFWEWASRPENQEKRYELDEGRIVEVPPPGKRHGLLCSWIAHLLWNYVSQRGQGGVCSNDTGLLVRRNPDTIRGPDVMLFDESEQLDDASERFAEEVPRLIVEVLSPSDTTSKINRRISQYLKRGVPLVWLVDPEVRIVTVYRPGQSLYTLEEAEELTGEDVLPDLRLTMVELFRLPGPSKGK